LELMSSGGVLMVVSQSKDIKIVFMFFD
jgi:hypothetical protein